MFILSGVSGLRDDISKLRTEGGRSKKKVVQKYFKTYHTPVFGG
jgi:hypothetical protein